MARENDPQQAERKKIQEQKKKLKSEEQKHKKEAKKRAKEIAAQEAVLAEDEESNGIFTFLATIAIVAVWLGIICIIIKLDVGGFGSNVLRPILKDVPVVNMILPATKSASVDEEDYGGYTSLSEAVDKIKILEQQLDQAQGSILSKDETIAELKATNVRLQEFESRQVEFQRIKTEFYEEVIYAEKGPGAEEYRKYFESMDPTTAEYLYKQVVKQLEESKEIQDYASAYSQMKPKQAAAIFENMTEQLNLAARILKTMNAEARGKILGAMDPAIAAKLTKIMDPES